MHTEKTPIKTNDGVFLNIPSSLQMPVPKTTQGEPLPVRLSHSRNIHLQEFRQTT